MTENHCLRCGDAIKRKTRESKPQYERKKFCSGNCNQKYFKQAARDRAAAETAAGNELQRIILSWGLK